MRIRNLNARLAKLETRMPAGSQTSIRVADLSLLVADDLEKLSGICDRLIECGDVSRQSAKDQAECAAIGERYMAAEQERNRLTVNPSSDGRSPKGTSDAI